MTAIVPITPILPVPTSPDSLIQRWLARQSETTRRAYRKDIELFAAWVGIESPVDAIAQLMESGHARANQLVEAWISHQIEQGLAPSTTNRRLASIRSVVALARSFGIVEWGIDLPCRRVRAYRDTRGPGLPGVQKMVAVAGQQNGIKASRDVALLLLLFTLGLRREEVSSLNVAHFDRPGQRLHVLGKGHNEREWITVPPEVVAVLARYLDQRVALPHEPLFTNLDRAGKGKRLTGSGIYRVVRRLGLLARVPGTVSPHRIRHSSITQALDLLDGDIRRTQHFSRHARIDTVVLYDDARQDHAGKIAALLTDALELPEGREYTHYQAHPDDAEIGPETA